MTQAQISLLVSLQSHILSYQEALIFTQLLWKSGPKFESPVAYKDVAKDLCLVRQAVSRAVLKMEKIGLITKRPTRSKGSYFFRFLDWESIKTLVKRVVSKPFEKPL